MSLDGISAIGNETLYPVLAAASNYNADFSGVLSNCMDESETDLDSIFDAAAKKYNLPVDLLKAVAKVESNFRADATSGCGAMGIMQLMPGTAKSLGVTDAYDPVQNIMGGAKYLRQMLDQFDGNTEFALAAYNAGPGNVTKYNGIPPFEETQNYVEKVMGYSGNEITAGSVSTVSNTASDLQNVLLAAADISDKESLSLNLLISIYQMIMNTNNEQNVII